MTLAAIDDWPALLERARLELPELGSMPRREFIAWLRINRPMYEEFRRFAVIAIKQSRARFSAYMIRERVRWYVNVESQGGGDYKISNNVTPYMARVLAMDLPELLEIFSFKDTDSQPPQQTELGL